MRSDGVHKQLRASRLDNSHEREMRRLITVDLLILDDFCLDMDDQESRDVYEILPERHQLHSIIVTSNRGPDEWLTTLADPLRAQSAIDRLINAAYELVLEGETYRRRLKPSLKRPTNGSGGEGLPPSKKGDRGRRARNRSQSEERQRVVRTSTRVVPSSWPTPGPILVASGSRRRRSGRRGGFRRRLPSVAACLTAVLQLPL